MIKSSLILLFSIVLMSCNSSTSEKEQDEKQEQEQEQEPVSTKQWMNFECDSAVAYLYNVDTATYEYAGQIVQGDSLSKSIEKEYSSELSPSEVTKVAQIMSTTPAKESFADCFEPHHGIVFYNQGKITGHISICFLCDNMHANPETFVTEPSPKMFKQLLLDHGIPVFETLQEYLNFNGANQK